MRPCATILCKQEAGLERGRVELKREGGSRQRRLDRAGAGRLHEEVLEPRLGFAGQARRRRHLSRVLRQPMLRDLRLERIYAVFLK